MYTAAQMRVAGEQTEPGWGVGVIRGREARCTPCAPAQGSPHCPCRCAGTEDYQLNSECNSDVICPPKCRCESSVVECSNLKLTKIPERIPQSTVEL